MIKEFKTFIARGNVMDLAIGVIMGSAFGKIVSSVVDDILMPIIGVISGGIDFTNLQVKFGDATISYGNFIQNVVDFLITSFCIFIIVKFINKIFKKETKKEEKKSKKSEELLLLTEIRDLLKKEIETVEEE